MKEELYEVAELEVIAFQNEDIVTDSFLDEDETPQIPIFPMP